MLQTTYPLGDEIALKLTTARWYTPSGRTVQRPRPDGEGAVGNRTPSEIPEVFHSKAGRPIPDASGILPDLMVGGAPRAEGERALMAALGEDAGLFRTVLADYATEVKKTSAPKSQAFGVNEGMRGQLFDRLLQVGIQLPRPTFDSASAYIDDQLGYEITRVAFGPTAEAKRRGLSDRQMQTAVRLLQRGRTQEGVLALAAAKRARSSMR